MDAQMIALYEYWRVTYRRSIDRSATLGGPWICPKAPLLASLLAILILAAPCLVRACDTALMVIDVQNLWLEERDWRTISDTYIVDAVAEVLGHAREAALPVIYIKDTSAAAAYAGTDRLDYPDVIAPSLEDYVFEKQDRSAFTNGSLLPALEALGTHRLIVCGIASDGCVAATVSEARELNFDVVIVADAHSSGVGGRKAGFMNGIWAGWGIPLPMISDIDFAGYCPASDEPPTS
ncbi:cysteine hydrolase family protein [Candidatus Bipolaricaulota bacterium]